MTFSFLQMLKCLIFIYLPFYIKYLEYFLTISMDIFYSKENTIGIEYLCFHIIVEKFEIFQINCLLR